MAASALLIALVVGLVADLISGLVTWGLRGDRAWWRRVSGVWPEVLRLARDRKGRERVTVIEAGGTLAALLGAGVAAAGALDLGPGDLPLLYLSLAVASAGALLARTATVVAEGPGRSVAALAEPAFAVALTAMFLRYGALDLEAVRGTQQVLGTGVGLAPGLAVAGLLVAALAFVASGALRLSPSPEAVRRERGLGPAGGAALLVRLCRWSLAGATSLVAGALLAGGGLNPLTLEGILPVVAGACSVAALMGAADAVLGRLTTKWRLAVPGAALLLAGGAVATVVLV
jgi:hypothetical protein